MTSVVALAFAVLLLSPVIGAGPSAFCIRKQNTPRVTTLEIGQARCISNKSFLAPTDGHGFAAVMMNVCRSRHRVGTELFADKSSRSQNGDEITSPTSGMMVPQCIVESFRRTSSSLFSEGTSSDMSMKSINMAIVERGMELDFQRQRQQRRIFFDSCDKSTWSNVEELAAKSANEGGLLLSSPLTRVPGCIATVNVRTALVPIHSDCVRSVSRRGGEGLEEENGRRHDALGYHVVLDGDADALLSRGLLALLSSALSGDVGGAQNDNNRGQNEEAQTPWDVVTAADVLRIEPRYVGDLLNLREVLSPGRNDGLASIMTVVQTRIRELLNGRSVGIVTSSITASSSDFGSESGLPQTLVTSTDVKDADHVELKRQPTVAMLLSGGVDSSVALNLLVRQNYNVTAFYLKIWLEDELAHLGQCPWEDDYSNCVAVCEQAKVPLETISLQGQYKERVISYTVREAQRGRTPNPDIMCNSRIKFGCFYDAIADRDFDYVASGHYAQLVHDEATGKKRLYRAPDPIKDQSYFLCALGQDQLERVLFPIGSHHKSEVRDMAEQFDLPNKHRPDSQGLCFLGKVKFDDFLSSYLGNKPGPIIDADSGKVIGQHQGLWYHTVGQRKGIGRVLHPTETNRGPWFVVAKDPQRNLVFASNQYEEEQFTKARSDFYVEDIRWIAGVAPDNLSKVEECSGKRMNQPCKFDMKIRHGPKIVQGSLELIQQDEDGAESGATLGNVRLNEKDGGLAPGQFVAFYDMDDGECLGAGVISEQHWAKFMLDSESVLVSSAVTR